MAGSAARRIGSGQQYGRALLMVLCALVVLALPLSSRRVEAASIAEARPSTWMVVDHDGGACEDADEGPELIACAGEIEYSAGEPVVLSLMRTFDVHMSEEDCEQLIADLFSEQICEAGSRDCGKLHVGTPPGPGPKLASSSSSANAGWAELELDAGGSRRMAHLPVQWTLDSRDLPPPTPPPKLLHH